MAEESDKRQNSLKYYKFEEEGTPSIHSLEENTPDHPSVPETTFTLTVSRSSRKESAALIGAFTLCFLFFILPIIIFIHTCIFVGIFRDLPKERNHTNNACLSQTDCYQERFGPEQVRQSLGENGRDIYVTWSTIEPVESSKVLYRRNAWFHMVQEVYGYPIATVMGANSTTTGSKRKKPKILYNYRAKLVDLKPGSEYIYAIETKALFPEIKEMEIRLANIPFHSFPFRFSAPQLDDPDEPISVAMYGNLGLIDDKSKYLLMSEVQNKSVNLIIQNGGFAFDRDANEGQDIDKFMRGIELVTARVPYQTSVGKQEVKGNFTYYNSKFTMINGGHINHGELNNFYYSFNAGPVHFVAFCTEFYFGPNTPETDEILNRQYRWLEQDLQYASSPQERSRRPWIVVYAYRPMYCSGGNEDDECAKKSNRIRVGLNSSKAYALEELFYRYGVDLQFYAHEQRYERFLPVYNNQICNGTDSPDDAYLNPLAPVHLISGPAEDEPAPVSVKPAVGSVRQISTHGYSVMSASRCRLEFKHKSSDFLAPQELDAFVIKKSRLTNFPERSQVALECH